MRRRPMPAPRTLLLLPQATVQGELRMRRRRLLTDQGLATARHQRIQRCRTPLQCLTTLAPPRPTTPAAAILPGGAADSPLEADTPQGTVTDSVGPGEGAGGHIGRPKF